MPHSATYRPENIEKTRLNITDPILEIRGKLVSETHSGDLGLGHPSETSVEVQVLSASQELIDCVELRAVAHVLVHVQDLCLDAGKENKRLSMRELTCLIKIQHYKTDTDQKDILIKKRHYFLTVLLQSHRMHFNLFYFF